VITEEEKIRRRKIVDKNSNITGAGFGEEIDSSINNLPEVGKWINGEIQFDEYQEAVIKFIKNI
jgi:hypothetical protein